MGRASRKDCATSLEIVRLVDDSMWNLFHKKYPHGLVIADDELALLKGTSSEVFMNARARLIL